MTDVLTGHVGIPLEPRFLESIIWELLTRQK